MSRIIGLDQSTQLKVIIHLSDKLIHTDHQDDWIEFLFTLDDDFVKAKALVQAIALSTERFYGWIDEKPFQTIHNYLRTQTQIRKIKATGKAKQTPTES